MGVLPLTKTNMSRLRVAFITLVMMLAQSMLAQNSVNPNLTGDIVMDGKVDQQDLNALVNAYLSNTQATQVTDLDGDGSLTIADISSLISIINENNTANNNGHEYVDLGLPSGTLWATCNVGATTPEEAGDLYAWGETETKNEYSWATYKWCDGDDCSSSNKTLTKYCDRNGYGIPDGKLSLELEDDVAHVKWGGNWHIPTMEELQELVDNCTIEEITLNASSVTKGFKFTGTNGNSIILPFAGDWNGTSFRGNRFFYWSSNIKNKNGTQASVLQSTKKLAGGYRNRGYSVRPVLSEYTPVVHQITAPTSYLNHDLVDLGLPSGTLWATCNLGASKPEGYGCYYAWGETTSSCNGKTFSEDTYDASLMTKYSEEGVLDSSDDAATYEWGGAWRMPTQNEIKELENSNYTTCEWTQVNGIYGCRITSIVKGFEGNSIFLPAAGQGRGSEVRDAGEEGLYWGSTTRLITESYGGVRIRLGDDYCLEEASSNLWKGYSIRPVVSLDAIQ